MRDAAERLAHFKKYPAHTIRAQYNNVLHNVRIIRACLWQGVERRAMIFGTMLCASIKYDAALENFGASPASERASLFVPGRHASRHTFRGWLPPIFALHGSIGK